MKFSKAFAISSLAAVANGYELLRDYANGFRIGCATNTIHYGNKNYINAVKSFNYMVAENGCKFSSIQGTKGKFNFVDCDNHLKKAQELGMDFRGHALVWHQMAPGWLEHEDGKTMRKSIIDHITTVLKHYEGKIDTWDVVNEAIDDGSDGKGWKFRQSFLYKNVPDFIDVAFQTARKVSPNTKLFYNDYNTEGIWAKSESVYQFVADMKKRNIPIDGVGIQYHVGVDAQPKFNSINSLISRYCDLGLEVHITELDVSCDKNCNDRDGGDAKQGEVYANALKACLGNKCCTGFLVWGVGDNDSWRGGQNKPLLFNSNYQPKGQYNTLLNILKTTPAASRGSDAFPDPTSKVVKLKDGWYNIINPISGKYLAVKDGKGAAAQNVELGNDPQNWKLTNLEDDTITLTSELGDFMLDVASGSIANDANIQIYNAHGGDAQRFILRESPEPNQYVISTKVTKGNKVLDIAKKGTKAGSNILQWNNEEKANQLWRFLTLEGKDAPKFGEEPEPEEPTPVEPEPEEPTPEEPEPEEPTPEEPKEEDTTCWSTALGYKCCSHCIVFSEDDEGKWGLENDEWCGIPKECEAKECKGAAGYGCCQSTCDVIETDENGDWGLENGDWCLIDKSIC